MSGHFALTGFLLCLSFLCSSLVLKFLRPSLAAYPSKRCFAECSAAKAAAMRSPPPSRDHRSIIHVELADHRNVLMCPCDGESQLLFPCLSSSDPLADKCWAMLERDAVLFALPQRVAWPARPFLSCCNSPNFART